MTVRKEIPRPGKHRKETDFWTLCPEVTSGQVSRSCGERANAGTRRRNGAGSLFGANGKSEKWRERMRDNPYKDLPPLERRPDGSLYRMTPAQRKQAASLIRRECCCCEDGNCCALPGFVDSKNEEKTSLKICGNEGKRLPLQPQKNGGLAQLARAPALHAGGQRFESVILHNKNGL